MARGNQREKARENNLKKQAVQVRKSFLNPPSCPVSNPISLSPLQKKGNGKTGSEMARDKDNAAAIMRQKQADGEFFFFPTPS